jgi:hypothetical protein
LDRAVSTGHYKLRPMARTDREILALIGLADRHLAEAEWMRSSGYPIAASQLARAYDACVVAGTALIASYGYRSDGDSGHEQVFRASRGLMHLLGREDVVGLIDGARDVLRPARHEAQYDALEVDPATVSAALETARVLVPALVGEAAASRSLAVPTFEWGLDTLGDGGARRPSADLGLVGE